MRKKDLGFLFESTLWRKSLVLIAVLSLAISVATRYSVVEQQKASARIVKSQSLDATRQHLLNDSLHWSAPSATFVLFVPTEVSLATWTAVPSVIRLHADDFLYSRPPPSSEPLSSNQVMVAHSLRCPQAIS
jgi:hypothetical protein